MSNKTMIPQWIERGADDLSCRTIQFIEDYNEGRTEFFRVDELMSLVNDIHDYLLDISLHRIN